MTHQATDYYATCRYVTLWVVLGILSWSRKGHGGCKNQKEGSVAEAGLFHQDTGQVSRFTWRGTNPSGATSIGWYDRWVNTKDRDVKERILIYNEDDCVATRVLLHGIRAIANG